MIENQIELRPMTRSDWDALCRVHAIARAQELERAGLPVGDVSLEFDRERIVASPGLVAVLGGDVVGFVVWWTDGYLSRLYVDPAAQRRGIGRTLWSAAMERVGPEAWTNAFAANTPAVRLYESCGMRIVWSRPEELGGVVYQSLRLALPTSRMSDPDAVRFPGARS